MLEAKLHLLNELNTRVEGDSNERTSFNIAGTQKSVVIDKKKLREAIQIKNVPVVEQKGQQVESTVDLPFIPLIEMSDVEYLEKCAQIIGPVKKA